jgi:hypothetical protein
MLTDELRCLGLPVVKKTRTKDDHEHEQDWENDDDDEDEQITLMRKWGINLIERRFLSL